MAMEGVEQPEILEINETLRLRRYDGAADFAFAWYQDPELVYLVDGVKKPYDRETLYNMYNYLDQHGELYFIEARAGEGFAPIGDVAFSPTDLPIVIGVPEYRGRGVGRQVILALMDRGGSWAFPPWACGRFTISTPPPSAALLPAGSRPWRGRTRAGGTRQSCKRGKRIWHGCSWTWR